MTRKTFEIVLKDYTFKKNKYEIREYFESLKYVVDVDNEQVKCTPTFLKNILSGGSFWTIDTLTIESKEKEIIANIKISKNFFLTGFVFYAICMVVFLIQREIGYEVVLGFLVLLVLVSIILVFSSVSEIKKEIKYLCIAKSK